MDGDRKDEGWERERRRGGEVDWTSEEPRRTISLKRPILARLPQAPCPRSVSGSLNRTVQNVTLEERKL